VAYQGNSGIIKLQEEVINVAEGLAPHHPIEK